VGKGNNKRSFFTYVALVLRLKGQYQRFSYFGYESLRKAVPVPYDRAAALISLLFEFSHRELVHFSMAPSHGLPRWIRSPYLSASCYFACFSKLAHQDLACCPQSAVNDGSVVCNRKPRVVSLALATALDDHFEVVKSPDLICCRRWLRSPYSSALCYSPWFLKLAHWDLTWRPQSAVDDGSVVCNRKPRVVSLGFSTCVDDHFQVVCSDKVSALYFTVFW